LRIERHHLVDDVMRAYPKTIGVFPDFRMVCMGCTVTRSRIVADACTKHHIDSRVLTALQKCSGAET
jgi:hybrid cluster-associated redox disulfide protein